MAKNPRGKLADEAYQYVKNMLISGSLGDDKWIAVDQVASALDVSRQPVMDALRRLAHEGFVEIVPQVGCRARDSSDDEIRDFYRLYSHNEAMMAELAAERVTDTQVLAMRLVLAQTASLLTQRDQISNLSDIFRSLNRQLHAIIREAASSPILSEIVDSMADRSDFFVAPLKARMIYDIIDQLQLEHERVVEAIAAGDPARARQAMLDHINGNPGRIEESILRYGRPGEVARKVAQ